MMDVVLNVRKEKGFTSHDVVAKLRGILHLKKIGHSGTLDPEAEGVLPVVLGKATRLVDMLTEKEKNVVTLYYYEDLTLKEISLVLNVSESRVSQLHTKALNKMRNKLGYYMEILA